MKIAFVSAMESHPWGGSEELWRGAAVFLARAGHEVTASVKKWPMTPVEVKELRTEGVRVFERDSLAPASHSIASRVRRKLSRKACASDGLERWLESIRPDLVCVSNGNFKDGLQYLETLKRLGLSYSPIVQANAEFLWPRDDESDRLVAVYENAHRVYCVSHANRRLLKAQLAAALPNAEVVFNPFGVHPDAEPPWPETDGEFRLACVARLEPGAKGQDLLFSVLARSEWRSRNVNVSLYGEGVASRGLKRLARMHGLDGKVHFRGYVKNVESIWATHHALVMPSRYEGLPLALVEALRCGRMAIVTDVAGNCEVVRDGVNGFVAAAPTEQAFASAMERAWASRARWREMGLAAHRSIRELVPRDPCGSFAERLLASVT